MHLGTYLSLVASSEQQLAAALDQVAQYHTDEPEIYQLCPLLASWSRENLVALRPFLARYSLPLFATAEQVPPALFAGPRPGSLGLLRDLHDLWLLASQVHLCWLLLSKGAQALHDSALATTCLAGNLHTERQRNWLLGRLKEEAPQTLAVAEERASWNSLVP